MILLQIANATGGILFFRHVFPHLQIFQIQLLYLLLWPRPLVKAKGINSSCYQLHIIHILNGSKSG